MKEEMNTRDEFTAWMTGLMQDIREDVSHILQEVESIADRIGGGLSEETYGFYE